ncbi:preprotein translocase subunit YajC [Acanthopleuribacter pedis]|uniref:Sec translocon accessory complex subunit YajC n=1 Tax=Acanthopleuribacter pedis TaxID=442870 RepID=A0A8J7U289_9BACT|nr:preprotein translocase subunit YajC [Acanthopleuribacter pedis]MBO1319038.1 preprotein translocase subunit YajC [Acanthopleuribacter pedis]
MWLNLAFFYFEGGGAPPLWFQIAPIVGMIAIFYFLIMRPQIKQQKEQQRYVDNLKKGDKVITSGGVWGEIDSVDQQVVILKVHDKTKIKMTRSAITGPQPLNDEGASK